MDNANGHAFAFAFVLIGIRIVESRDGITKKLNPNFKLNPRFMISLKN